ncbi:MAG: glycosyltransferase family 61 protein [Cypionkella sp.]
MLNQIGMDRAPEELILDPFADQGLKALRPPEFLWRPTDRAQIHGFAASEHPQINGKIQHYLSFTERFKTFDKAIEFNTFPVHLDNAWFKKSFITVNDLCLISGAAGMRLLNRYCWGKKEITTALDEAVAAYFKGCQDSPGHTVLPVLDTPLPAETPFAIECRNTFNYYHFVTESLGQLCLVAETGLTGPIYLHYPNNDEKVRSFTNTFIQALFPELADRVIFQRTPVHHPSVVVPYNFSNSIYQMDAAELDLLEEIAPPNVYWRGKQGTRASHGVLAMNAVDSSLLKLRARALKAIEGKDFSYLPKRFWVSRDDDHARVRSMKGEAEILEMLALFGFETVSFERLSPLEQIAIMANAEMMISYHGAGFTNMLFANPKTYAIEIGTLQTAMFRWGDFWRLANASSCNYVNFFADFNAEDPLQEPDFAEDGIVPVHLSPAGLAQVMCFVVSILGHIPKLSRPAEVLRLGQQLMRVGAQDRAQQLYQMHAGLEEGDVDLSLAMADCHEHFKDRVSLLKALYSAYRADPAAWTVLIRIIWCAKSMDHSELVAVALSTLQDGFPDRFESFIKGRPWVGKYIDLPGQSAAS